MKTVVIKLRKATDVNIHHAAWRAERKMADWAYDAWRVEGPDGVVLHEGKRK